MEAKELRIGNYIEYYDNGWNNKHAVTASDISHIDYGDNAAEPIELTEEWLLKFGFVQEGEYWILNDAFTILQSPGKKNFLLSIGTEYTIGGPFEYVHQLQNLYFALTGNELL